MTACVKTNGGFCPLPQQHQSRYVHCIKQEQALQGRPITPELHQQDSHTYSDVTPPADPSPTESPIPQHSGQTHYAPSQHHGQPYGQADSDHEYYQQPQDGYAALGEAMPNGQDYHTAFAPREFPAGHSPSSLPCLQVLGIVNIVQAAIAVSACQHNEQCR